MRQPKHSVSDVDTCAMTGLCAVCGPTTVIYDRGQKRWRCLFRHNYFSTGARRARGWLPPNRIYRRFLKDRCERCGFVPEHMVQLQAHHANLDKNDHRPENILTLCTNCHALQRVGLL